MFSYYGLDWDEKTMPLVSIELLFVRSGGYLTVGGKQYGNGLFHHFRELQKQLWPEGEDHHRWSDLMLHEILQNRITVVSGARDSGKTHVALSRYGLTDYFCFPHDTLILVSSTDLRGLQMRVWGDMKDLWERAKNRFPWLPGNIVESLHGIFTDSVNEETPIRDQRKGIICIPCLDRKGSWTGGLQKFVGIKQKRRRLLGDECFIAGTMVDTPSGPIPIEKITPGDTVINALGMGRVVGTRQSYARKLCCVSSADGRVIVCTPAHKFLTQKGWVSACHLTARHYMLSAYEAMSIVQGDFRSLRETEVLQRLSVSPKDLWFLRREIYSKISRRHQEILQPVLSKQMAASTTGVSKKVLHQGTRRKDQRGEISMASGSPGICGLEIGDDDGQQSGTRKISRGERLLEHEQNQRVYQDKGRICFDGNAQRREPGLEHGYSGMWRSSKSQPLSDRCSDSKSRSGHRSRWMQSQNSHTQSKRYKKGKIPSGAWVVNNEVFKSSDFEATGTGKRSVSVFNLQVENHHSYSVAGFCVQNCQFMHPEYLNVLSNLDKGDFKFVGVGNALANMKALDKISEPLEGWGNHPDPTKTEVYPNRWGGRTITLVGTDSPNFDVPAGKPEPYSYLVSRADEKSVAERYGRNSEQYYSQIAGYRKPGLFAHRVLTPEMCERCGAFDSVIWQGTPTTKVYAIDMGFGGDRCVAGWGEFGHDVRGNTVFRVNPPSIIPISVDTEPEDQIALYARKECGALDIPGAHVFFDAGMKATAATAMAKLFSPEVNAVNFGGSPTKRPVSADEYVVDRNTGARRLKRCDEHYIKFVTELWFSVRLTVLAKQMRELPKDVAEEFYLREWTLERGDRYELETKDDTKERTGVSPDLGDWLAILIEGARRLGFMIESLPEYQGQTSDQEDYLKKELTEYRRMIKTRTLRYA